MELIIIIVAVAISIIVGSVFNINLKKIKSIGKKDQNEDITNYNIVVTSPTQEEQVWADNGIINVSTNIRPKPQGDFSLKIFIDNSLYESVNNSTKASVSAVPRGEHTIFVKLQTRNGKIYTSNSVKFYVFRHHVQPKRKAK